jgi:hypothetical protein
MLSYTLKETAIIDSLFYIFLIMSTLKLSRYLRRHQNYRLYFL